jgi:hypothetical protein
VAFEWLDKAMVERDGSLIYLAAAPLLSDLLSPDPRYTRLLRKMGLEHLASSA